ncbi:MAG: hypothetical protein IJB00_05070 [Akkermansia sp.]|nr:hypothetical protein [Akkermansia sp.]
MKTAEEIISHIPLNRSDIARLTLKATEEPGRQAQGLERSQLLHLLRRVIRAGAEAVRAEDCTVSFAEAAWASVAERKGRRATTLRDLRHFVRRMLREECSHCAKAQACGVSRYLNLPQVKQAKEYWLAKASQKVSSAGNQIKISRNASG